MSNKSPHPFVGRMGKVTKSYPTGHSAHKITGKLFLILDVQPSIKNKILLKLLLDEKIFHNIEIHENDIFVLDRVQP